MAPADELRKAAQHIRDTAADYEPEAREAWHGLADLLILRARELRDSEPYPSDEIALALARATNTTVAAVAAETPATQEVDHER